MCYACRMVRVIGGQLLQIHFFGRLEAAPAGWSIVTRVPARSAGEGV